MLFFAACFTVVFVLDKDCQKRYLIGTDRIAPGNAMSALWDLGGFVLSNELGHKARCCKVQIVFLVLVVVFIVVVAFGLPHILLL